MDQIPKQRIKKLETELREQKRLHAKQVQDEQGLNLRLRTLLQVVEQDHGHHPAKKVFPAASTPLGGAQK